MKDHCWVHDTADRGTTGATLEGPDTRLAPGPHTVRPQCVPAGLSLQLRLEGSKIT